jgi:hypothetical protein
MGKVFLTVVVLRTCWQHRRLATHFFSRIG